MTQALMQPGEDREMSKRWVESNMVPTNVMQLGGSQLVDFCT